jgi:GNAT superfamily N-acetyltransferase
VRHRERIEELVGLHKISFNHSNISIDKWDWKYIQNPFVTSDPELIVALYNREIVGAKPFILGEMWIKDRKVKFARPSDTMVHPKHRRKGIFSRMNQYSIDHFKKKGYALFCNTPGSMSRPGYLKQGWRKVLEREFFFRIVNPRKVISDKLNNSYLGNALGLLYGKLLNKEIDIPSNSFNLKIFDKFDSELSKVDVLRNKSVINLVRDENYLRWRFDQNPKYRHKYILVTKDEELLGYAVIGVPSEPIGLVIGRIVDYLVKGNDTECFRFLMSKCINELEKSEIDLLFIRGFSRPEYRKELMEQLGFKSSLKVPYNRFVERICFLVRGLDKAKFKRFNIYDKENWPITFIFEDY